MAIRFGILLAPLAVNACDAEAPPPQTAQSAAACEARAFEGSRFTICRYDAARDRIELILDDDQGPLRNFTNIQGHLGARAETLRFAMNAGMYDEGGMPIGLYVENGRERKRINLRDGPGNFHMKPNGVFAVGQDRSVSVTRAEDFAQQGQAPLWATQSGPMLIVEGRLHPDIRPDGESRLVRNGVGVSDPRTAWFVISDEPVSFGKLARLFRDQLGCRDALFLDGSVSSLWDRPAHRQDAFPSLGPVIAVFADPVPERDKAAGPSR
jgi:uncharacterized protein YigE (DUF2233 family)